MQFKKRSKNFLIFLILVSFTAAHASPSVRRVKEGEPAPFTGWCFNDEGMAKVIADKEQEGARCQLKLNKQQEMLSARFKLDIGTLQARLEAEQTEHASAIRIKNEEIKKLEAIALDQPNDYWYLFTAGGFVIGASAVLGIWVLVGK